MNISKWRLHLLRPYFRSKAQVFAEEGYPAIGWEDVERYFLQFAWKRQMPVRFREQKQAILTLAVNDYFDFERLEATVFKVSPLDEIDIDSLL